MGLLDLFFGKYKIPVITSIFPDAAKMEIMSGRLPHINTDKIFLKKGEYCCFIDKAILLEEKKVRRTQHMGVSTPGLFSEKNRVAFGESRPYEYTEIEKHKAILYITNQRIILDCKNHGFDKAYKYLSTMKPYSNGLDLQYGNKTYSLILPPSNGDIAFQAIKLIQQRRSY